MCGFFEVPCPLAQCPERLLRKEVPDHLSWRCQQRQASCDYCQATMPLAQLQVGAASLPVPATNPSVTSLPVPVSFLNYARCLQFLQWPPSIY